MASAWFNALADPVSALGLARSGLLTNEMAQHAHLPVTMGCGEECPFAPGLEIEQWSVPDPEGQSIQQVRLIRDQIRTNFEKLIKERFESRG